LSKIRIFFTCLLCFWAPYSFAADKDPLTCYVQLNKAPDWSGYSVQLSMYDINTQKIFTTFSLPQAKGNQPSVNSLKKPFDCKNHNLVSFTATFSPPIWQTDANKKYIANVTWNLTPQIVAPQKDVKGITITINFPDNFIDVPALNNKIDYIPNQTEKIAAPTY
jgi:hypothetical protein